MGSEAGGQARQGDSPQSQKTPETVTISPNLHPKLQSLPMVDYQW